MHSVESEWQRDTLNKENDTGEKLQVRREVISSRATGLEYDTGMSALISYSLLRVRLKSMTF